jgi:hypothetical protein
MESLQSSLPALSSQTYDDIAGIGYEAERLPQDENDIQPEQGIQDDKRRTGKTDVPESHRQDGGAVPD